MKKFLSFVGVLLASLTLGASVASAAAFIVPQGGTGQVTLSANQLLVGNGTSAIYSVATSSATCGTGASCTAFAIVGAGGTTITTTLGTAIDSSEITDGTIAVGDLASADFGDFTCNGSTCTIDANAIALATDTTGNYIATLSSSGSITVGGSGSENAAGTVDLNMANANTWTALQTFANASTTGYHSFGTASSTNWTGGGLTDCDTGATSKLLYDATTMKFSCGTDQNSGGGGGSGNVATSSSETSTHVAYWTSTGATPATLGSDAGMTYSAAGDRLTLVNASTTNISTSYASSTVWRGGGLTSDCDSDAQTLGWDLTTGMFTCGDDDSGVGGGVSTIKEGNSDVVTSATAIDFGAGFDVAAVVTEGDVTLDLLEYNGAALFTNITSTGNASTTLLSANQFWAGQTATTSINSAGTITIGGNIVFAGDTIDELVGAGLALSSNDLTVDNVTAAMLNSEDFGSFTCNGTTCTIDSTAVTAAMLANADFGDFTCSGGSCTVDANAIALSTDTTGNYVATLADDGQSTITVNNSGSEGAAVTLRAIDVICTGCLGTTEIAGIDIGDDTNLTAGRSLTLTGDTVDADSELYTFGISGQIFASTTSGVATTTEDFLSIRVPVASTITGFGCYADDSGTSTIKATVASNPLAAGTNILYTTGVNCGAQVNTSTSTFSTTAVAAGSYIRIYVSDAEPTGSRPRVIYPNFTLTKDD